MDTKRREAWHQIANSAVLHEAILHTQAQMAAAGFGPQEMTGVNNFIMGLLNLAEDIPTNTPIPAKVLKSWDDPVKATETK